MQLVCFLTACLIDGTNANLGRERDFTILSTGTTNIVNIFPKNGKTLIGGDRLWFFCREVCCDGRKQYLPDDQDGGLKVLDQPQSGTVVRISAMAGADEFRSVPLVCNRCNGGNQQLMDCECGFRLMYPVWRFTRTIGVDKKYTYTSGKKTMTNELTHVIRVGEVEINREMFVQYRPFNESNTNMLHFNMNRRIMAILNT
jgi:hypothetical protein